MTPQHTKEDKAPQDETPSEDKAPQVKAPAQPKAKAKAVRVLFVPVGTVRVHVCAPSGNEYNIEPRKEFKIAAEDVNWFFTDWDWSFRQRLVLAEDYEPTCGYHDPKLGQVGRRAPLVHKPKPTPESKPSDMHGKRTAKPEAKAETNSEDKE